MTTKRGRISPAVQRELEKEEWARLLVAQARADREFMAGVREALESRGKPGSQITLEELKRTLE